MNTAIDTAQMVVKIIGKSIASFVRALVLFVALPLFAQEGTQTIRGTVLDRDSRQPLIGASVTVLNGKIDGGTLTDAQGNFKLSGISLGRKTVKVTYIGYETVTQPDIIVTAAKEIVLNLTMAESVTKMDEVTIRYDRRKDPTVTNNEMTVISSRSFNPDDTKKFAGSMGDPSRMASNFAGVVSGNDSRNDIVIRGNSPNSMLWQLEGVNIPNPNHFGSSFNTGGPVSMLNANNIGKSDFFTSAFPAQYGNANGGVFDLVLREGNNEKREYIGQIGFNGFELGAEGPFSKKSKASFLFNYRYSTIGLMNKVGINVGTGAAVPLYQDLNFKIAVPIGKKGKLAFWGMGGISSIDLLAKDVDTTDINFYGSRNQNSRPRYRTMVGGISYERNVSKNTWARATVAMSEVYSEYTNDSIAALQPVEVTYPKAFGQFADSKISAVLNLTHKVNAKNALHAGFSHDITLFDYFNKVVYNMGTIDSVLVNRKEQINLTQAYLQWKHRVNALLTFNLGVHMQYLDQNNQFVAEPRLGIRYALNHHSNLNLGYGLHHQSLPIYNYFVRNDQGVETNLNLKFMRSNHLVLGYENMFTQHFNFKIEGYYQYLDQVPVEILPSSYSTLNAGASFDPSNAADLKSTGTGYNYGAEITLERFYHKGFYLLITGSVFESKYQGSDGVWRNTAFNTNYAANVLGGKEFKPGNKNSVYFINIRATTVGGRYITPIDPIASQLNQRAIYDYNQSFSSRQAPYFRVDLKVGYRKDYKKSSMEFAIDFQNITNHQNIFSQGYDKYRNAIVSNYQQGFFPVPMFRYTF